MADHSSWVNGEEQTMVHRTKKVWTTSRDPKFGQPMSRAGFHVPHVSHVSGHSSGPGNMGRWEYENYQGDGNIG